ncbi:hypothetical protein [Falsibacillus pallidus]|uniref:Uncharacterized protein n=1 Tax=Falsibacillus pallidus TaxID=493781 RepID=A0A370FZQ1_9BACI|nr:hypothetical protein [Falsibacillus pallidus]RDI36440.1 hypothetical protein DFR59_13110 [Falsibacillus pallidus]
MNYEICALLRRGGVVSCFLTDSNGDPLDPSAIICEEISNPNGRESVTVMLPTGQETVLQKIKLLKSGFVVVQVTNGIETCISNPIPFSQDEQFLMCAPDGTKIKCMVSDFKCTARIVCRNGIYQSVDIKFDICQSIQTVTDAVIELSGEFCTPREIITKSCVKYVLPPSCDVFEKKDVENRRDTPKIEPSPLQQVESFCIKTEKVYDWILQLSKVELRRSADEAPFNCNFTVCEIALFVPADIVCERTLSGFVACDGIRVGGVPVTFTATSGAITFSPNPTITDAFGNFSTIATVEEGTNPTDITITASATVGGENVSNTLPTKIQCLAEPCILFLFGPESISCNGVVDGRVRCGNTVIPEVPVTLTANPPIVTFDPNPATTGMNGNYFSGVIVPPGTPPTDVEITASATVDGQMLSASITVNVSCASNCVMTLQADPLITCSGEITGTLFCNGLPVGGAEIFFSDFPAIGTFSLNPTTTEADGSFTTTLTIPEGTPLLSTAITATTTVLGQPVSASIGIQVECITPDCTCKFRIGVSGGSAPANVDITIGGAPSSLSGTINVTAVQCFTAAPMCNPAVDNFNVTFGSGGNTINFIVGRRIEINCDDGTFARVRGTARATGNTLPTGLYEVTITLTITGSIGHWTVDATDFMGNTFSTAFTSPLSPITFIGDCSDRP